MRRTVQSSAQGVRQDRWSGTKWSKLSPFNPITSQMESVRKRFANLDKRDRGYPFIYFLPENPAFIIPYTDEELREVVSKVPRCFLKNLKAIITLGGLEKVFKAKRKYHCGYYWDNWVFLIAFPKEWMICEYTPNHLSPNVINNYIRTGAKVEEIKANGIRLTFNQESLKRFYLQEVLMHEIGHHLDNHNTSYRNREDFAQWFATEYGYRINRKESLI